MSDVRVCMMAFLIIATCSNTRECRAVGWVMTIVFAAIMLAMWLIRIALGIEVR